jgi:Uma2 family endonuclease
VICGPSERDPESATHVVNPTVIFEVLSPGTESYDRGEKLEHYKQIESLHAVVLVHHRAEQIDVWSRGGGDFTMRTHGPGETMELEAIGCRLSVADVYASARGT